MQLNKDDLNNLFVKFTFIHHRCTMPGWGFSFDRIGYYNLILVYDGSGIFESRGERKRVGRGDLVLFHKGDSQRMTTDREHLLKLYTANFYCTLPVLSGEKWSLCEAQLPFDFVTHVRDEELFEKLKRLFDRLCRVHLTATDTREAEERAIFANILELASFCGEPCKGVHYRAKSRIDNTLRYMTEHYSRKLSLAELADYSGLSVSHFSAIFKKVTGYSPVDYLIHLRITKAKRLLEDGGRVSDVAQATGFSDIYYFSNVFKKTEGQSPSEYVAAVRKMKTYKNDLS